MISSSISSMHRGASHSGDIVKPGWGWCGKGAKHSWISWENLGKSRKRHGRIEEMNIPGILMGKSPKPTGQESASQLKTQKLATVFIADCPELNS